MDIKNLEFISYYGISFPFEDNSFDLVVTRYALHYFPEIKKSIREVARVLKGDGLFFVSDPRPNDCDITRFVDDYMQLKKDGHIKFYTKDEWVQICRECNMHLVRSFDSEICFPKKKSIDEGLEEEFMCTSFVINKEKTLVGWNLDILDMIHRVRTTDDGMSSI